VLSVLDGLEWRSLHLRLPESWEDAVKALREGFDFDYVVEEMQSLGQIRLPEDLHLISSWRPLLEGVMNAEWGKNIRCFRDTIHFERERQIALDMATLLLRARLGRISSPEWREILDEELDLYERESREEYERLRERVNDESVAIEITDITEELLRKDNFQVQRLTVDSSGLPLDRLRKEMMQARRHHQDVLDSLIERRVGQQMEFLDLVLVKEFDEAYEIWNRRLKGRNGS